MIEQLVGTQVEMLATAPMPSNPDAESKIDDEIKSLWAAHQASKVTVQRTRSELKELRRSLGERLSEMKSILARTGREGKWASYLRTHKLPRATADRYIGLYQALVGNPAKRLNEAFQETTVEDVERLVKGLLPRLRQVLTTKELVAEFLDELTQQLATN